MFVCILVGWEKPETKRFNEITVSVLGFCLKIGADNQPEERVDNQQAALKAGRAAHLHHASYG